MKTLIAIFLLLISASAQAGLILHISPDGFGGTRWEFSGSSIVLIESGNNSFWAENSGTLANTYSGSYAILTGSGTLFSTTSGFQNVLNVWASQHTFDGIAPRVSSLYWNVGDTISWSGDLTSSLPFANLNLGTISTFNILGGFLEESLTITVANTPMHAIPAPAPLALLGLGIALLGFRNRKAR